MEKEEIKTLVLQAAQGNRAAFGALYEETGRVVYFTCLKLLANAQLAEDITQETFLTALQKLGTLTNPENFQTWVNRIAINLCKMHFRGNTDPEENSEEILDDILDEDLIPEEYVSNDAKRKIIMDIIDTVLTEEQRQSVILYYFDMLTVPEIADVMGCTTGTVTSRLSAARKKIKEAVLIYEENNNDRLHAAVPVFILSKLLMKEASTTALPKLIVFTSTAANAVPDNVTSTKTISGGKGMFSTVKAKVIAGVCAVAVVGGGITAAVMLSSNSNDDDDDIVVVSSQKDDDSTVSKGDETVSDTANDNKNSDLYWIDGFNGGTPSASLDPNIFGSEITLPIDLSQVSGGNGSVLYYGDEICKSKDIYSLSNMLSENYDLKLDIMGGSDNKIDFELNSDNPFERDASVADILKENSWSITIPLEEAVDTSGWEYESYGNYSNKKDLDKIIDKMGCPTSIYMNSEYDGMDNYKCYKMYWENVDYTISLGVVETYRNYEEYDVVLDYFSVSDFTYYSKNYPQEEIHEKDGEAVFTSEYTGITTPGESTVNTDENRVKVYDDLKTLDLTSDAALPKDISVSYKGIDHVFTGIELIDDVRAEMVDTPDDEYDSALCYGKTSSTIDNIIIFDFWLNSDHTLHKIRMSFTTESDCSIFGITKNSTPEEMAAILGTPEVSDRNGKDQFLDWKSDSMSVNAYYYDGVLQSIQANFES